MPPETMPHQLSPEIQGFESAIDVSRPEQVAYLLPYSGEVADVNQQQVFITVNPSVGTPEEIRQLMVGLESDLKEDLKGIGLETEQTYTPMMFADESGILETLSDQETNEKIDKMVSGEIPGEIPSSPAIKVKADKAVLRNPIFAEISATLIGKQLDKIGKHGEAWLDNLLDKPEAVCIQTGDYTLMDVVQKEHHTQNVDQGIRDEVVVLRDQPKLTDQDTVEHTIISDEDIMLSTSHLSERKHFVRLRNSLGKIALNDRSRPRIAH